MPLRIQIQTNRAHTSAHSQRMLTARSQRVKSVDVHPREPWVLSALFDGKVYIWNYQTQALVKSFELIELPVRCAKFIAREGWFVAGCDDMMMRAYNYNTMDKIKQWEAHTDYIRCVVVHPAQPYVLSSSDDMTIKLWDWSKNWQNTMVFEGHTHYVMQIAINPKDTNTFASSSLDRTVKVWGFNAPTAHFTLEGHEKGVNAVEYALAGDKPYIVSGADDKMVKVWDYQNKTCVQTLEGHRHNVSMVCFHPVLPVIVTGSEDGTVKMWNSSTYRLEKTLNYGLERVWCAAYLKGSNVLALGYDEGTVMLKLGSDSPAVSMDPSGKVVWARHNEILTVNVKPSSDSAADAAAAEAAAASASDVSAPASRDGSKAGAGKSALAPPPVADGEPLPLAPKELGNTEIFPQVLLHDPKGRFVVVCGDGEFVIYTALAWRNKAFGQALEFVWMDGSGDYAVRESTSKIKLFANFKERHTLRPDFSAERIFGGALLGVRSETAITFFDWQQTRPVRKIDVCPTAVYWSDTGDKVALVTEKTFYVLQYNKDLVNAVLDAGATPSAEGIDDAFEVVHEIGESVDTALWIGDCFVFSNTAHRLNYYVGGEIFNIAHLERQMFLLGYLPKEGRLYLSDKDMNVVSYKLQTAIINYQTAILRGDVLAARRFLHDIGDEQRNRLAQFLESQGLRDEALEVSSDPDHKFDLAIGLNKLNVALELAQNSEHDVKWKTLADAALKAHAFALAETAMLKAHDCAGLLLLYTSLGNTDGVRKLAAMAAGLHRHNVAFLCNFLLRDLDACIDTLVATGRAPEAAFFARTYKPSRVSELVSKWRVSLAQVNAKAAESLADPAEYPNLFTDFGYALRAEEFLSSSAKPVPYADYAQAKAELDTDVITQVKPIVLAKPVAAPASADATSAATTTTTSSSASTSTTTTATSAAPAQSQSASPHTPPASAPTSSATVSVTPAAAVAAVAAASTPARAAVSAHDANADDDDDDRVATKAHATPSTPATAKPTTASVSTTPAATASRASIGDDADALGVGDDTDEWGGAWNGDAKTAAGEGGEEEEEEDGGKHD